jgi:radical SAM superfamily enzyme YgiQ (UPF0313 family)
MDLLLINPPVANFGQAPAGPSVLVAYLRARGWDARQWDLAIDAFHHFHAPGHLEECLQKLEQDAAGVDPELIARGRRAAGEIDAAKVALRTPGVERDREAMRRAFGTIHAAGVLMTAASLGAYEHNYRDFSVAGAFDSFEALDAVLRDPARNPYLAYLREHALPRIRRDAPKAVGVSITYFSQVLPGFTLLRLLADELPGVPVVLGGAYMTAVGHRVEDVPAAVVPAAAIVLHDGEASLDAWLRLALKGEGRREDVANGCFPGPDGTFVRAREGRWDCTDLDRLPVPMWTCDGLDLGKYLVPRYPIPLPLSRGCHWGRCVYCNISSQTGAAYRTRPVTKAVEDMRAAISESGSNAFDLPVDSFRPADLHALAKGILEGGLDVVWGAEVLLDRGFLEGGLIETLARSGCRTLRFGMESACEETLRAMQKPTRPGPAREILGRCRANKIRTGVMLIAGFPTETQGQLRQTYDFLAANRDRIDFLTFHHFALVPGSRMARDPAEYGLYVLERQAVLSPSLHYTNTTPVGMRSEDLPRVVEAMKDGLREYYPDLDGLWSVAIGGWMTFPACCAAGEGPARGT